MSLGYVMLGVRGCVLTSGDLHCLDHPQTGVVILFRRNFSSRAQLVDLIGHIRQRRSPELLIAVDHEGGRVQRFTQDGFTHLPPMALLGELWDRCGSDPAKAFAYHVAQVLAYEIKSCGLDFSYAPVLDVQRGRCTVIGDRAWHRDAAVVAQLACSFFDGLSSMGVVACGKHFPGHGYVTEDSHTHIPL